MWAHAGSRGQTPAALASTCSAAARWRHRPICSHPRMRTPRLGVRGPWEACSWSGWLALGHLSTFCRGPRRSMRLWTSGHICESAPGSLRALSHSCLQGRRRRFSDKPHWGWCRQSVGTVGVRGAAGFRACVLGAAALAGTPRPGVGRLLSWPAAEGALGGASSMEGGAAPGQCRSPAEAEAEARMPWQLGYQVSMRGPCGALGCEERRPLQGRREGPAPREGPALTPARLQLPHGSVSPPGCGQRVGACQQDSSLPAAHVFPVCTCVSLEFLTFLTVLVKERLSPRFASRVTEARLKALGGA